MPVGDRVGILLTAFGGPDSIESVGPFMARFMGREPSSDVVEAAQEKYRAIGGSSPLPGVAASVASALERHLRDRGHDVAVRAGMRYWEPSILSAVRELAGAGAERLVMSSLSSFESKVTCEAFRTEARLAAVEAGIADVREATALHLAPQYRDYFGHGCAHLLEHVGFPRPLVVMTAHSLPVSETDAGEDYAAGLRDASDAIAAIAGLAEGTDFTDDDALPGITAFGSMHGAVPWLLCYQSRGVRPGAWLGPDLGEVMAVASGAGFDGIVVVPIGFAIDHMETLWDLDVEAEERARALGLAFARARVPNDDDAFVEALMWAVEPLL